MKYCMVFVLVVVAVCSGCSLTKDNINHAFVNIEKVWKADNDKLKRDHGVKSLRAKPEHCFSAAKETLDILGFTILEQDLDKGMIIAKAPSPKPLTAAEWAKVKRVEEPKFKDLADQLLPGLGRHVCLATRNWEIQTMILFTPQGNGTEVAVGFTQTNPGMAERGYYVMKEPPPMTAKLGMLKFWMIYEVALKVAVGESLMKEEVDL